MTLGTEWCSGMVGFYNYTVLLTYLGVVSAVLGYAMAVRFNTSVAGMIATVGLGLFMFAAIASPRHGVIARQFHRRVGAAPEAKASEVTG